MRIAVFKDDPDREPYLVHYTIDAEGYVALGLRTFPAIEMDNYTFIEEVEFIEEGTEEHTAMMQEILQMIDDRKIQDCYKILIEKQNENI